MMAFSSLFSLISDQRLRSPLDDDEELEDEGKGGSVRSTYRSLQQRVKDDQPSHRSSVKSRQVIRWCNERGDTLCVTVGASVEGGHDLFRFGLLSISEDG